MKYPNINVLWQYVRGQYPDARFDFWYHVGELHFYPNGEAEKNGDPVYGAFLGEDFKPVIKMPETVQ